MTIACCYVSPEGVVFGADSTTSYGLADGPHYLNHAQKIFQIGCDGTLAIMFWGLAELDGTSFRTLAAELGDEMQANPVGSVEEAMGRWIDRFSVAYEAALNGKFKPQVDICRALAAKPAYGASDPNARTEVEEETFQSLIRTFTVGFCIGGYVLPSRNPVAWFVHFEPLVNGRPAPASIAVNNYCFWGAPNMIKRLIWGVDDGVRAGILSSGKWSGTPSELDAVLGSVFLGHPVLPLREVIDFVHACIHSTIKALKFSHFSQICGGPIELAVISTDRDFRWVRHKTWDAAVVDGDIS